MAAKNASGLEKHPSSSSKEVWQCYQSAHSKEQVELAFEALTTYIKLWLESGKESVTPSPMISVGSDRYGYLKPCLAFDSPGEKWNLKPQPPGLLSAIQKHLDIITEKLLLSAVVKEVELKECGVLMEASNTVLLLARLAGYRENYNTIGKCGDELFKSVIKLVYTLLDLFKWTPSLESVLNIILALRHGVAFLHCVVDPRRAWQKNFMHLHTSAGLNGIESIPVTGAISDLFVAIFTKHGENEISQQKGKEAWQDLQLDVLHMMGAMFSSSKKNCEEAWSEQACVLLLTLFDPRECCTPVQVLVTKVFVKIVHVLHTSIAETQIGVDAAMMLVTFLNMMSSRYQEEQPVFPCIKMVTVLLDAVPSLLKVKDAASSVSDSLKQLFVAVGCYEKICEVLEYVEEEAKEKPEEARQLLCSIFSAFSAVTQNCPSARRDFERRVGHSWLSVCITRITTPTKAVLQEALNMVVEGEYKFKGNSHIIYNITAIKVLFRWLFSLSHPLQLWLMERLHDMCAYGSHNKQRCCVTGVLKTLLEILTESQHQDKTFQEDVEGLLIDTIEVLGSHSITSGELKQLIESLRSLENGTLPTYYYRLQKSLTIMADSGSKGMAPRHYFDLRMEDTYISIPDLKHFPSSSSFSFHLWVCLDSLHKAKTRRPLSAAEFDLDQSSQETKMKRILYSFYTNGGTGFEAFFTTNDSGMSSLVVATVTKKDFITLALNEFLLEPQQWYSISVVYSVPKRPWSKSEIQIYINGELKKISVIKTPSFSDTFTSCLIGFGPSCGIHNINIGGTRERTPPPSTSLSVSTTNSLSSSQSYEFEESSIPMTTSLGDVVRQWGKVTNLRGLISSFCIFSDALSASSLMALHTKGPNDLSNFQHKCPDTYELGNKVFLYYHAKSMKKDTCVDLSPLHVDGSVSFQGVFTGQVYVTWDIKAVLGSQGGVEVLFPILEQLSLPLAKRHAPIKKEEEPSYDDKTTPTPGVCLSPPTPDMARTSFTLSAHDTQPPQTSASMSPISDLNTPFIPGPATTPLTSRWFDETEAVAAFLKLLIAMLSDSPNNQNGFFHSEGPATIAALLMKTPPSLLTVSAFQAVQELVELFNDSENRRLDIYKHLVFDFRVWSKAAYSVRIGHIQYINKEVLRTTECRQLYGIHYIMDVIRNFYGGTDTLLGSDVIQLDNEQKLSIRSALLMIIKYYLMNSINQDEVEGLLGFVAVSADAGLQEDLLNMLKSLLTKSDCGRELGRMIWERGTFLLSLIRAPSMPVRLTAIKILCYLMRHYMDWEGPIYKAFRDGSMAAAIALMTEPNMSSAIILSLTDLCIAKNDNSYTDYISNLDMFLSLLQLLRIAPFAVRNTLCQQVNSVLHHTPEDILRISSVHGWEVMFFWLLTAPQIITDSLPHPQKATPTNSTYLDTPTTDNHSAVNSTQQDDISTSSPIPSPPTTLLIPPANSSPSGQRQNGDQNQGGSSPPTPCRPLKDTLPHSSKPPSSSSLSSTGDEDISHRSRSFAFADKSTTTGSNFTITNNNELMDKETWKRMRKQSLTVSTPWTDTVEKDLKYEVTKMVDIVSQTFRHILWHSTLDQHPWKVWGKFFSSLDEFVEKHEMVVPAYVLKQKLLTFLCHDVTTELKRGGNDHNESLDKLLYTSQQLESFIICSYPSNTSSEDQEVQLLKLAHNFFPEINIEYYSRGLQEEYLKMLTGAGIFDKTVAFTLPEIQISQSAIRILLGCLGTGNKEYYVTASLRLEHLLKCPFITLKDVSFIFSNLARIAQIAIEDDDSEWLQYVASILRCLFSFNFKRLLVEKHLPQLPDHRTPNFGMEFGKYCTTTEWENYVKGPLKTAEVQYSDILMRWLLEKTERTRHCAKAAKEDEIKRKEKVKANGEQYQKIVVEINSLLGEEVKRQQSKDSQLRNELSVTLQRWRCTRRFFTGERGAWSSRKPEPYLWKLDRTENFSRMRMRLARNYNYNTHEEASKLRDTGLTQEYTPYQKNADTELLAKIGKRTSTSIEEEDVLLEQLWSDANSPAMREGLEDPASQNLKEKELIKGVECHLVMLMDRIPGRLEITSKHLYFLSDNEKNQSQTWYSTDFKIPLSHMREIHSRRYNMSRTALEIFLIDQTNCFINFPNKKVASSVYRTILSLHPPNLNRVGIRKPAKLLKESGLTQKWSKREISNFDYLIQLNTISGRTYNDLNQYPVFPWVLKDYTSEELDLENEEVFRDFSKPVGIQNPKLVENVQLRYEEFDDPTLGKFHFGSHYSNAAGVMHYLIRMEPFTSLHIELQSGKFDFADRQFFSIPSTWANIYNSGTDQKELIPEFFYQPEFLKNLNELDLGKLQTGKVLNDVILPAWASCAEDFIIKHRDALESEYVSAHLHDWIDLIFGYKQTGPEAVKACNIFNFYTYEENVNLDDIKDEKERRQIESIINNFGQTPTQLFTEPHPQRLPLDSARKTQAKGFTATFTGKRLLVNLFDHLSLLKAHSVDVCQDPVVFVGTPSIQTKALLVSGNLEQLVTVNEHGLLNVHGWLAFSNSKNRPFTFQFDPNAHLDKSRWQYVGGPFVPDIGIKSNLFVLSPNNKYLASGGHWDNSFRVYQVEKRKLAARISHHNDVVTCMALDKAGLGDHLITGSRDTSCAIWKFGTNGIQTQPLQTLYGHDSEVLCVGISTELDLAVSGAKDGTCLLHTVRQGLYINTLKPRPKSEIHQVAISNIGRLVVYTEDTGYRQKLIGSMPPCLHLYTINGLLLAEKELNECINALVVVDKYLITGNTKGYLTFRNLYSLQQLHSLNLLEAIHCVWPVLDHHSKLCTHVLVGLANGKLIIVSVKEEVTLTRP